MSEAFSSTILTSFTFGAKRLAFMVPCLMNMFSGFVGSSCSFCMLMRLSGKTDSLGFGALIDYLISETATDLRLNISIFFEKSEFLFDNPGNALYLGLTFGFGLLNTSGTFILFSIGAITFSFSTFSTILFGLNSAYFVLLVIEVSCFLKGFVSTIFSYFLTGTSFIVFSLLVEAPPKILGMAIFCVG